MSDDRMLRVHFCAANVRVLGPGVRYVVWTQGCPRRCPGCVAPEAQPLDGGQLIPVETLARRVLRHPDIEGLTLSGGEPFLQCEALCALVDAVREKLDAGVIVYTGYTLEELQAMDRPEVRAFLSRIDLLIDGPYIEELNDGLSLRGSSNQRVLCLTERYRDALGEYGREGGRPLECRVGENGFFVVGIPDRDALDMLHKTNKNGGGL